MGNQPSRSGSESTGHPPAPAAPQSHGPLPSQHPPAPAPAPNHHAHHAHYAHYAQHPRRRESIHALSVKASAAPPSASLESARPLTLPATVSTAQPQPLEATLRGVRDTLRTTSDDRLRMGNEQSRTKTPTREHHATPPKAPKQPPPPAEKPAPSPQTQPVDVPALVSEKTTAISSRTDAADAASLEPRDASQEYLPPPASQLGGPPRLPLPIGEEVHTPGSPIISPADVLPIDIGDVDGVLPRRSSVLSSTTIEDDDLGDEFQGPQDVPTVPTIIEWEGPGERVYVTGTFAGWNRKYRLHRNGPSKKKDVLSTVVNIAPGTHHLKFIVDNDMRTSDKLPTAVDYTNILVNYLEVSLDDVLPPAAGAPDETIKSEPVPVQDLRAPPGIYPPQTLPPTPELPPEQKIPEPPKPNIAPIESAPRRYHSTIPRYLLDLDAPEESSKFARANAASSDLPPPPTLPMFLSKSILNGTTPMKDDSSVLIMPNHTVLNHLATSSIKDNILATSATTRYKQKFLTSIMYKPKNAE